MQFIYWLILGLIAGIIAKFLMPGKDGGGIIATTILGIVGAFVGGFVFRTFGFSGQSSFSIAGLIPPVVGAMIVLYIFKMINRKK